MTQKVPQKFWKKISQRKSAQKVPKFLGGEGVRTSLENTQIKATFFCGAFLTPPPPPPLRALSTLAQFILND